MAGNKSLQRSWAMARTRRKVEVVNNIFETAPAAASRDGSRSSTCVGGDGVLRRLRPWSAIGGGFSPSNVEASACSDGLKPALQKIGGHRSATSQPGVEARVPGAEGDWRFPAAGFFCGPNNDSVPLRLGQPPQHQSIY
jgi:hypothetical protein